LIQQLRVMFDEYNAACQEKEYYEDLSEALFRYIEICEGNIVIQEEVCTQSGDDENISNLITNDQDETTTESGEGATAPKPTPDRVEKQAESTTTDHDQPTESMAVDDSETTAPPPPPPKQRISNNELIRLNHILLKELIELRNERDMLRESVFFSGDDASESSDALTEEEDHACEHCSETDLSTSSMSKKIDNGDDDYEHNDDNDDMKKIENEYEEDTE